ncbi:hypothetical protein F2Q69_00014424 [Brassica cretica]|uniref:Uncharacterized protein n=1 Tax=Brassica cretica TaxID=69181 RepID=A0A8S9QN78_BRACR|nr:hypothetical protein F2Q69_00014424 [Brassica cretica]
MRRAGSLSNKERSNSYETSVTNESTPSTQGVPDPSSDDLGLFNLSSQTRRSQTARDNISSRSDQFQLAVHLFGGPFNLT